MDIIYHAISQTGILYVDTIIMTGVGGSGIGSTSAVDGPWHSSSWAGEYQPITASSGLLQSDSARVLSNEGAGGSITLTLPLASEAPGAYYRIVRVASQAISVDPDDNDRIVYSNGVMASGEFLTLDSDGAHLSVVSDGDDRWIAIDEVGTLTEETP